MPQGVEVTYHFHLVFRVTISRLPIPFIFALALFGCLRIQLVREILDSKSDVFGIIALSKYTKSYEQSDDARQPAL